MRFSCQIIKRKLLTAPAVLACHRTIFFPGILGDRDCPACPACRRDRARLECRSWFLPPLLHRTSVSLASTSAHVSGGSGSARCSDSPSPASARSADMSLHFGIFAKKLGRSRHVMPLYFVSSLFTLSSANVSMLHKASTCLPGAPLGPASPRSPGYPRLPARPGRPILPWCPG